MVRLGKPVLNTICLTDHVEVHLPRPGSVPVARLLGELDEVISQDRMNAVRRGFQQVFEELPSCSPVSLIYQLGDREIDGAINADEQIKLAFDGFHLGDIYVEEANWIAFEALALRLVALDVRQTGYAVSLEASV